MLGVWVIISHPAEEGLGGRGEREREAGFHVVYCFYPLLINWISEWDERRNYTALQSVTDDWVNAHASVEFIHIHLKTAENEVEGEKEVRGREEIKNIIRPKITHTQTKLRPNAEK